ncbi:insulin-degrading enzyme, partial [Asbolus verrucosus]
MDNNTSNLVIRRVENIIKSQEDKRLYRGLELSNHMKVLLVSDSTTDKSAAALDVNVGYMSDPKEVLGLAHFCEHMLFLGTEKYPNENDYSKFLSEHGGSSNAATYPDHTIYYFDIVPDELHNALDRFSQFFIAPLFTESATDREVNAVNSEHEKNIPSDVWRKDQLDKHMADPNHPYHTFGTESLDELEEMVVKLFSAVKDKSVQSPKWEEHPFKEEHFGTCVYMCPIKDVRNLNIVFPCPDLQEYYKSSPSHYISHLMGHEGPGSILSTLKARGWSNNLVAGSRPAPRGMGFFGVTVDLTEDGIEHINDIVELIFQYINMLKTQGPQKWVQDENRDIGSMLFRFKDKESPRSYISGLVHTLQITEHPTIIQDTALTRVWFKQDETFLLPKANVMFDFCVSPLAYLDPLNCNLTHMLVQLFRDALNEYAYAAELAGLKWELINTKYGLILAIGGYSNKQHIFLDKVMEKLTNFKIDPKRFEICKENYIRNLKNFAAEQPYQHAVYYLAVLLTEHSWTKQELLAATEQLTIDKLEAFIPQILSRMHIECLIHGNANKEKALQLVQIVEDRLLSTLSMSPLLPRQLLLNRELKLEDGCNYLYEVQNEVHKESCIELYYQCGLQSKENNMKLELFAQIIQEPCFDILRTKEQLGYIVFSGIRRSNGVQGLRIIVQSDKHPTYLDDRIEEFLKNMLTYITNMSEDEFLRHREALAAQRLEKPKQLSTQTNIFWGEITAQQYHFDRANIEVSYLRTLTKEDIIEFYKSLLEEAAHFRKKLSVHVVSMADGGAGKIAEKEYTATIRGPTPSI